MTDQRDITGTGDLETLIRTFYGRCFDDDLLGPIFVDIAHLDLEEHLPVMVDFWSTVLFRSGAYRRNVLDVHVALDGRAHLTPVHLDRWLELWTATVGRLFAGPKADLAVTQAKRFAWSLNRRLAGESGSELTTVRRSDLVLPLQQQLPAGPGLA